MSELIGVHGESLLPAAQLVPTLRRIGSRDIEVTYLGHNSDGHPTWIFWNANDPYLIGVLTQGGLGFKFEQRTGSGVFVHLHVTLEKVQQALNY